MSSPRFAHFFQLTPLFTLSHHEDCNDRQPNPELPGHHGCSSRQFCPLPQGEPRDSLMGFLASVLLFSWCRCDGLWIRLHSLTWRLLPILLLFTFRPGMPTSQLATVKAITCQHNFSASVCVGLALEHLRCHKPQFENLWSNLFFLLL